MGLQKQKHRTIFQSYFFPDSAPSFKGRRDPKLVVARDTLQWICEVAHFSTSQVMGSHLAIVHSLWKSKYFDGATRHPDSFCPCDEFSSRRLLCHYTFLMGRPHQIHQSKFESCLVDMILPKLRNLMLTKCFWLYSHFPPEIPNSIALGVLLFPQETHWGNGDLNHLY